MTKIDGAARAANLSKSWVISCPECPIVCYVATPVSTDGPPPDDIAPFAPGMRKPAMDVRAAVAVAAGKPLEITTVQLEGPRAGEVLVEIKATGVCHTDGFTLSGADPEGLFPAILGHEGAGIVVDVGAGVTSAKKGDHVIPLYTPECRQCPSCLSRKTNLCTAIRATQGQGLM